MFYQEVMTRYQAMFPDFPHMRRPLVGAVIKEMRIDKGIRQKEFARMTEINESTLKSIENDHQNATTVENLERCSSLLGLNLEELIIAGREKDPCNFFSLKKKGPPIIEGIRKRKRFPQEWRERKSIRFRHFNIHPISPPLHTQRDFFVARLEIPALSRADNLEFPWDQKVSFFAAQGFNLIVEYAKDKKGLEKESFPVTANQGFSLNGYCPHSILNHDREHTAVLFIVTRLHPSKTAQTEYGKSPDGRFCIAEGIDAIRRKKSDRKTQSLSLRHLADLTETLDHEQIDKLRRLKKGSSVIYWEKIEDLLAGTEVSMENFLKWCRGGSNRFFAQATAATRPMVEYETYFGVKIYGVSPPSMDHEFFCGEISISGKKEMARKSWERKDQAMIALYVEEGTIEVTVGKSRSPIPILKGESVYFDGSLGYLLRNPAEKPAKGFFATFPGIQI